MKFLNKIPHVDVDITVYEWNTKYIFKFEWNGFEQTYKVAQFDIASKAEVEAALTPAFIAQVVERFEGMQEQWEEALGLAL